MDPTTITRPFTAEACRLEHFIAIVEQPTNLFEYPHAAGTQFGAVMYDADDLRVAIRPGGTDRIIRDEIAAALLRGPGIVVLRGSIAAPVVDRVSDAFRAMIATEKSGVIAADHFAKPGANDRVWNTVEKLALFDPEGFVDYYSNDMIALGALAWLGPNYQISAQVNVVNPGGEAQSPHRDYHIGFTTDPVGERYPRHAHLMSAMLTLQGAVAHVDMPVESGPTMYLPHSQKYDAGYLAWRRPEFIDYFDRHHVQLPLSKGDLVYFNPALFHGAGHNRTFDTRRMANLLQISSAFGRAMESIDREAMTNSLYPSLLARRSAGLSAANIANVVAACAEGYPFPTNLDRDPPVGGLTPPSQADILHRALTESWAPERLTVELRAHATRRLTS